MGRLRHPCSASAAGLSPRERGNHDPRPGRSAKVSIGSIPARAGEPLRTTSRAVPSATQGLSPRERGNHDERRLLDCRWVYPRASGGTDSAGFSLRPVRYGLSPRERGNLWAVQFTTPRLRSTGLSPRERGNHMLLAGVSEPVWGLSPRERGNRDDLLQCAIMGSIPARAGEPSETHPSWRSSRPAAVYPRASGGTPCYIAPGRHGDPINGLSPRERGNRNPRRSWPWRHPHGSIPARAGEPCRSSGSTVFDK